MTHRMLITRVTISGLRNSMILVEIFGQLRWSRPSFCLASIENDLSEAQGDLETLQSHSVVIPRFVGASFQEEARKNALQITELFARRLLRALTGQVLNGWRQHNFR